MVVKDEIRVLAVEDDRGLRASLKLLLDSSPGFHCSVACMTAEEGLRHLGPGVDVVLMDINLPGQRGSEAVAEYRRKAPSVPVVMLTVYEDADEIFRSLCNGASGYILKKTPPDGILAAVKEAVAGGAPMSPEIARRVVEHFHRMP
ncbi:MAG TPA: response regulator transcription factor, partial [Thermoanaerobaculia bacterium]|nr:response regulator transcription factor [Thermoanaerobaculia bacterium]